MKKQLLISLLFIIMVFQLQAGDFKRIGQWKHQEVFGSRVYSIIDKDNHVVAGFRMVGGRVISADKLVKFAPRGEGPGDLTAFPAGFSYKGDLAIAERSNKIKVFTKKNGTYVWKETKWLKNKQWPQRLQDAIFYGDNFFLAGLAPIGMKDKVWHYGYLKIYNQKGELLKDLITNKVTKPNQFYLLKLFLAAHKDNVFFMKANEMMLRIISSKDLTEKKEIKLEVPAFYKKMPETFYVWKKYDNPKDNFKRDVEDWDMGYSSIQKLLMHDGRLVIQIRTANPEMKKFAILFYNPETFKLEKTVMLDDLLLGAKDGKFYCFANGNPAMDDDTDDCIINIYSFKKAR